MPYKHHHRAVQEALAQADAAVPDPSQYADRKCDTCGSQADYRLVGGGGGMMRPRSVRDACRDHRNAGEHASMSVYQSYTRPMNEVPQQGPQQGWNPSRYSWESR